jgi:hypothetical protein
VTRHACFECARTINTSTPLPQGRICNTCLRRRHYHPEVCPGCATTRPLAYLVGARVVCASCAGCASVFACATCASEDHPYGARRCARCILAERLTELLTDPGTGAVHTQLRPIFDELVGSQRPQTGIWWLRRPPGVGPRLLGQMARGEIDISHETFRALPSDRAHDYLRNLLSAVGVLPPFEIRIERMLPWIDTTVATLSAEHADLVRRFAHWHVLRHMRHAADRDHLTQSIANAARRRVRVAIRLLAFLDDHGASAVSATQDLLERYQISVGGTITFEHSFVAWLRESRINTRLHVPYAPASPPSVTVSDQQRWLGVERLLHDDTLRHYTRLAGLFTLLFAQPLSRIVAMRTNQITFEDQNVYVAFSHVPIQMPVVLDDLIREHLGHRGKSLYVARDTGWLFPGGNPGRHLTTENIRSQLVDIGIKPYEFRKATLFQLASDMPAPILAELIGITDKNAANWAHLAARDWTGYIALRAH